jgi:hypothetical protein
LIEYYGLIAAFFSALATAFAAVASWRAPITAARLAEQLRRSAQQAEERRRQKLQVFTTLMQERAAIYSEQAVRSLNVIDVVFNDTRPVGEAWAALIHALDPRQNVPAHAQQERIRRLLSSMATDLGLADDIRLDDLNRVYLPTPLAQERFIRDMERQQALTRLTQQQGQPAANVAPPQEGMWPPPP